MSQKQHLSGIQTSQPQLLYRVRRAATLLDVSTSGLYALIARGEVATVRVGQSIRVPAAEINRLAGVVGGQAA